MRRVLTLIFAAAAMLSGCAKADLDAVREEQARQSERLAALEEWQKQVNSDIGTLQSLVKALEESDYVTSVTPLADGSGYTIQFMKSGSVVIKHGKKGDSPAVSVRQDTDGKYYWTLDGEWLTDGSGNKVSATGPKGDAGVAPQVRINAVGEWEISTDGGVMWDPTGVKATGGDSIFSALDTSSGEYVELTLADGVTKIQLPRYKALGLGDADGKVYIEIKDNNNQIKVSLPAGFKESDYAAIMAELTGRDGTVTDIRTRAASSRWSVSVHKPTFTPDGICNDDAYVVLDVPDAIYGEVLLLDVTVVCSDGSKLTAARPVVCKFMDTVLVKGGKFMMGSDPAVDTEAYNDEAPRHEVTLTQDFEMGKYEVTTAQYVDFLNAVGVQAADPDLYAEVEGFGSQKICRISDAPFYWNQADAKWEPEAGYETFPMWGVTWFGAKAFADWVGGSLPTEAQWEYACRAGTTTRYSFGDDASLLGDYGLYWGNYDIYGEIDPVGTRLPNPWGLYDMHGNLTEWCSDWYGETYYKDAAAGTDPVGPDNGRRRVLRGGCFIRDARSARSAYRSGDEPDDHYIIHGFRVVFIR